HLRSVCPNCGEPNFCTPPRGDHDRADQRTMICTNFHVAEISNAPLRALGPDRFFVAKFLTPRRWDIVVFRYPDDPAVLYCMRLVGLPGDRIEIKEGAVWADGKRLDPPEDLKRIEYQSGAGEWLTDLWGTPNR